MSEHAHSTAAARPLLAASTARAIVATYSSKDELEIATCTAVRRPTCRTSQSVRSIFGRISQTAEGSVASVRRWRSVSRDCTQLLLVRDPPPIPTRLDRATECGLTDSFTYLAFAGCASSCAVRVLHRSHQ